jgi:hypothetical protein
MHLQLLYWQRQAMNYSLPPDQIVFSYLGDGTAMKSLPGCVVQGPRTFIFAVPWDRFYQLTSPPGRQSSPTLFLHELHNSRGESRLVVVEGESQAEATVFRPGTLFSAPQEVATASLAFTAALRPRISSYAGQCDPTDPSHFTIRIKKAGTTGVIEGWLKDDDTVAFRASDSMQLHEE